MKGLKLKCGIEWFGGDFWIGLGVREDEKEKKVWESVKEEESYMGEV